MAKVNSILSQRLKSAGEKFSKMTNLVEMSSAGNLSSFSGIFRVAPLNAKEQASLQSILDAYRTEEQEIDRDLIALSAITAEVKAINNQAIILHGERIKKAQGILKSYQDGAFSAWLVATYGNRQTPYNFLQYYELYTTLPPALVTKLDEMPRQAVYSLASRQGEMTQKLEIIKNYQGEPKQELLNLIRMTFPLGENDQRVRNAADYAVSGLQKLLTQINAPSFKPTLKQKQTLHELLNALKNLVTNS
jgi:hypothetical protein